MAAVSLNVKAGSQTLVVVSQCGERLLVHHAGRYSQEDAARLFHRVARGQTPRLIDNISPGPEGVRYVANFLENLLVERNICIAPTAESVAQSLHGQYWNEELPLLLALSLYGVCAGSVPCLAHQSYGDHRWLSIVIDAHESQDDPQPLD